MRIEYGSVRMVLYGAALLTPFTALRFGVFGIGEILVASALLMMLMLNNGSFLKTPALMPILQFWSLYLFIIALGFFYNNLFLEHASGTIDSALFDFMAYLTIFFVVIILSDERLYIGTTPIIFYKIIFIMWSMVYSVLYVLSYFTNQIYGFPLRYYLFFSPLVENVHQAAMITSVMPFIMWHLATMVNNIFLRGWCLVSGFLFVLMALESGATKAIMAIVVGVVISFIYSLIKKFTYRGDKLVKVLFWFLIVLIVYVVVATYFNDIIFIAEKFFHESDQSAVRENIYAIGFNHGFNSFIIGYGPGAHINYTGNYYSDAHNTTLTIFLQGGVMAVIILYLTIYRLIKSVTAAPLLLGAFFAISMYFFGGDILRRLPIWVIFIGIIYLSGKSTRAGMLQNTSKN